MPRCNGFAPPLSKIEFRESLFRMDMLPVMRTPSNWLLLIVLLSPSAPLELLINNPTSRLLATVFYRTCA